MRQKSQSVTTIVPVNLLRFHGTSKTQAKAIRHNNAKRTKVSLVEQAERQV